MSLLQLVVGTEAQYHIKRHGLVPQLFDKWIAASGGPKWLPLAPLERYLSEQFFSASQPLHFMGTSSGAWRCTALCHPRPVEAHQQLEQGYINQWYDTKPTQYEVEKQCRNLLGAAFSESEREAIIANPIRHLNIIVCHGRGLVTSGSVPLAAVGAGLSALVNAVSRNALSLFWQRWVLHAKSTSAFSGMTDLPTQCTQLTEAGLLDALMATGSIPIVLRGVKNLPNTAPGYYYDGGVTDYHLDLPALQHGGLTLYPHFYPYAVSGWFDKKLPWRRAAANFRKVAMLVPSDEFVAQLPDGKLPDRGDFGRWDNQQRIDKWNRSVELGQQLAEAFADVQSDPERHMIRLAD